MFDVPSGGLTVSIFLILYGVFMLFFVFYSLFNVFHLIKYGFYNFSLYLLVTVFTGGTIILIATSTFQMVTYDWSVPLDLDRAVEYYNTDFFPTL
jgi:hypothetical protein